MAQVQYFSRSSAFRQLGFGVALLGVLAIVYLLFRIDHIDSEAQPSPLLKLSKAERESPRVAPQGDEIGWGFSDRWFPLIQVVAPSVPETALNSVGAAPGSELVTVAADPRTPDLGLAVQDQGQTAIPLPRPRPSLADEISIPLPRPRPNGPAPQSVFIAVGTTDDRYPSP